VECASDFTRIVCDDFLEFTCDEKNAVVCEQLCATATKLRTTLTKTLDANVRRFLRFFFQNFNKKIFLHAADEQNARAHEQGPESEAGQVLHDDAAVHAGADHAHGARAFSSLEGAQRHARRPRRRAL